MNVYLDYAATRPLCDGLAEYITTLLPQYGNPSSQYMIGQEARALIDTAREDVARFVGLPPDGHVVFTCGGSAANSLVANCYHPAQIAYSPTMHASMLRAMGFSGDMARRIECGADGTLDVDDLVWVLRHVDGIKLVCAEYANSECGVIQPVREIIDLAHYYGAYVYLDCTGSMSTIPLDMAALGADAIGFSAHKLGGLKGTGAICATAEFYNEMCPLVFGEQEGGMFGGTENVLGIAAMGYAVRGWKCAADTERENCAAIWDKLHVAFPASYLIGPDIGPNRLANNLYICLPGIRGEALVELLDTMGVQISTGSACSTGHESELLATLGILADDRAGCIRITLGGNETADELAYATECIISCVQLLYE